MPDLVSTANHKYPGLNLHFLPAPIKIVEALRSALVTGETSVRFVVNVGGEEFCHFAAIDCHLINNNLSVLLFEPTGYNYEAAQVLADAVQQALTTLKEHEDTKIHDINFTAIGMDIQKSRSECGMFSLSIAKKLHLASDDINKIHRLNIARDLPELKCLKEIDMPFDHINADRFLPPSFYKHCQSSTRLREYLRHNPGAETLGTNKKNETLPERFNQYLGNARIKGEQKSISTSIHQKRIMEYSRLLAGRDLSYNGHPVPDMSSTK